MHGSFNEAGARSPGRPMSCRSLRTDALASTRPGREAPEDPLNAEGSTLDGLLQRGRGAKPRKTRTKWQPRRGRSSFNEAGARSPGRLGREPVLRHAMEMLQRGRGAKPRKTRRHGGFPQWLVRFNEAGARSPGRLPLILLRALFRAASTRPGREAPEDLTSRSASRRAGTLQRGRGAKPRKTLCAAGMLSTT